MRNPHTGNPLSDELEPPEESLEEAESDEEPVAGGAVASLFEPFDPPPVPFDPPPVSFEPPLGKETSGSDTSGKETSGRETSGRLTSGSETLTSGTETSEELPVPLSEHAPRGAIARTHPTMNPNCRRLGGHACVGRAE